MKISRKILALTASLAALVTNSFCASLILDTNAYSDSYGGGEFTASNSGLDLSSYSSLAQTISSHGRTGFDTFCLEYNEHFTPGNTYDYTLSNNAIGGDVASGSDPISMGTAWLYSQFASGTLAGYFGGTTAQHKANALQLQLAVWYLEDETTISAFTSAHGTYTPGSGNAFLNLALAQFGNLAGAKADANGAFGVQVLNLTSLDRYGNTVQNQSQLYYHAVPELGMTVALLGLSFLGLAGFRQKFASAK